jgi:hypothetical protein
MRPPELITQQCGQLAVVNFSNFTRTQLSFSFFARKGAILFPEPITPQLSGFNKLDKNNPKELLYGYLTINNLKLSACQ